MAGVVNLRRHRKRRTRGAARVEADANAARHGEPGAERRLRDARAGLETRRLEGHRQGDDRGDDREDDRENNRKDDRET